MRPYDLTKNLQFNENPVEKKIAQRVKNLEDENKIVWE